MKQPRKCPFCKDPLISSTHCEMCYQLELAGFTRDNLPSIDSAFWDSRKGQEIIEDVRKANKTVMARHGFNHN